MTDGSILDHPVISERYFFPRRDPLDDPFWVDSGEARLACHYHRPHPEGRTVIHFHGNGEVAADYIPEFVEILEGLGCNCLLAEYRGYGMSSGRPGLTAMLADVEPLIRATGEPPEKIVIFGRSVGSIYAVHAVSSVPRIAGLIIESGIADTLDRLLLRVRPEEIGATLGELERAVEQTLAHKKKLAAFAGPSLVMHTRHDGLLEVSHAERLHSWLPEPKSLKIFEQGNHNDIMFVNFDEYFSLVRQFIESLG